VFPFSSRKPQHHHEYDGDFTFDTLLALLAILSYNVSPRAGLLMAMAPTAHDTRHTTITIFSFIMLY
jgi:hypothetical protein